MSSSSQLMESDSSISPSELAAKQVDTFIQQDSYLGPYRGQLEYWQRRYLEVKHGLCCDFGSLTQFAESYQTYGLQIHDDGSVTYKEWAPGAKSIAVFGEFNNWNDREFWAQKDQFGAWSLTIPADRAPKAGTLVKLMVELSDGRRESRLPQWSFQTIQMPNNPSMDSVLYKRSAYQWENTRPPRPQTIRVYEAHVGLCSEKECVGTYRDFADKILPYINEAGYNVIQLMAIQEHSYYASFGYQPTSFFSPASRSGSPDDLKYLVDKAHGFGMAVLFDVVLGHASKNTNDGLNNWDGTGHHLFHEGGRGTHDLWDVRLFNLSSVETMRFLLSNLSYWMNEFRCDGFRFDAVTSMLYNHHGIGVGFTGGYHEYFSPATEVDSMVFLKLANDLVHTIHPQAITIAEDVSGMPGIGRPVHLGGLGFDFRFQMAAADLWQTYLEKTRDEDWKMGHIAYIMTNRRRDEKCIVYAECHDQSLVGSKTIAFWLMDAEMYTGMSVLVAPSLVVDRGIALHKLIRLVTCGLGGDGWLAFCGNEFGHPEWVDFPREGNGWSYSYCRRQWSLATCPHLRYQHLGLFDRRLMNLDEQYHFQAATEYVSVKDEERKILAFERGDLVFVMNFSGSFVAENFWIPVSRPGKYVSVLESDAVNLGGYGRLSLGVEAFSQPGQAYGCFDQHIQVYLPPRTAVVYALDHSPSAQTTFSMQNPAQHLARVPGWHFSVASHFRPYYQIQPIIMGAELKRMLVVDYLVQFNQIMGLDTSFIDHLSDQVGFVSIRSIISEYESDCCPEGLSAERMGVMSEFFDGLRERLTILCERSLLYNQREREYLAASGKNPLDAFGIEVLGRFLWSFNDYIDETSPQAPEAQTFLSTQLHQFSSWLCSRIRGISVYVRKVDEFMAGVDENWFIPEKETPLGRFFQWKTGLSNGSLLSSPYDSDGH